MFVPEQHSECLLCVVAELLLGPLNVLVQFGLSQLVVGGPH